MLPNHAPLAVAEQFALLEAAAPGRIDLGLGRAPGTDPVTSIVLRGAAGARRRRHREVPAVPRRGRGDDEPDRRRVAPPRCGGPTTSSRPRPPRPSNRGCGCSGRRCTPRTWPPAKGLPYVFAHHFSGQGTDEALAVYREEFRPSDLAPSRVTFLTVNASVAPTRDEAEALLLPNLQMMARLRTGQPLRRARSGRGRRGAQPNPQERAIIDSGLGQGDRRAPAEAADQLRAIAERYGVDEVMVNPVGSARRGTDPATAPARGHDAGTACEGTVLAQPPASARGRPRRIGRGRALVWMAGGRYAVCRDCPC